MRYFFWKSRFPAAVIFFFALTIFFAAAQDIHHNPWELIIYRPENSRHLKNERLWLKIQDENNNEITYDTGRIKASYEWVTIPGKANYFQKKYYIDQGMAVHLNLRKGKYKFSVFNEKGKSNVFEYDTSNPAKVIFIRPIANDNGFYTGDWEIDYKAPLWFEFTKPSMFIQQSNP